MTHLIFNNCLIFSVTSGQGEVAALSAACLWAIASVVYGLLGQRIPPLQLNLIKGVIAIALLVLTIVITSESLPNLTSAPICLLFLSGAVGIGLGDTAFLAAINYLGARRVLLIGTLSPPVTAIAAMIFLQEQLNFRAWCGILLTILGIAWVVTERVPGTSDDSATHIWRGIGFGLLAAITNATGAVLSRAAFTTTSISPLWAALLRLSAGVLVILICILFSQGRETTAFYPYWQSWRMILTSFFAASCGTYLGIWLQQTAIKFTQVGIALTLTNTAPLFILPIAVLSNEKPSIRAILGAAIALFGIAIIFYA